MKKALLLLAFAILTPLMATAQEMYAEYNGYGLLKFYYDDKKASREGTVYDLQKDVSDIYPGYPPMPGWFFSDPEWMKDVGFVVIDPSFDKARPTSTLYMFANFENLTKIEGMEYLHTEKVTSMYGMFSQSKKLTVVDVSHLDTRSVTNMDGMFDKCYALEKLDVSHFDVSQVEDMSFMFRMCEKLIELDVSGWDTQSATDMSYMFSGCSTLTKLDVSSFDTRNVENMDHMFRDCYDLKTLDLRSFDMSNVSSANEMFNHCRSLSTIYCNDDWSKTSGLTIASSVNMFNLCDAPLTGGNGTAWKESNKTDFTYARPDTDDTPGYFTAKRSVAADPQAGYAVFTDDDKTLTFYYDDQIDSREGYVYGMKYMTDEDSGYSLPEWMENAGSVERVVFDPSYIDARPTTMDFWLFSMSYLKSIENLEFLNTSAVTSMVCTFASCAYLQGIDLTHFNTSAVTDMSYMFGSCSNLYSLDLTRFDMSSVKSTTGMFSDCIELRTIYCNDDWTALGITSSDDMFSYCSSLTGSGEGNKYSYNDEDTDISRALPCTADTQGYFTSKPVVETHTGNKCDVNGDGSVDVADIATIITEMASSARRQNNDE